MHHIQQFEKEIRFPSGFPSFPSLLPSNSNLFPSKFKKQRKMLSHIDITPVGLAHSAGWDAHRRSDTCLFGRPHKRVWNIYRDYASRSGENKITDNRNTHYFWWVFLSKNLYSFLDKMQI